MLYLLHMDNSSLSGNFSWNQQAARLSAALHLAAEPAAIAFTSEKPRGVNNFDGPMSEKSEDGRQGRVAAGCVFWMHAAEDTFVTEKQDHGNCSVGSFTHGLTELKESLGNTDIKALLESNWIDGESVYALPYVKGSPNYVTYGPLKETPDVVKPDVLLLRINGRQLMILSDALPDLKIVGKPQCHIIAIAKEENVPAASVGCALSRVRTGMRPEEMTCAIPAKRSEEIISKIEDAVLVVNTVAKYAAQDARKFSQSA